MSAPPPLTREADLQDQRLQRQGGQLVGAVLGIGGLLGIGSAILLRDSGVGFVVWMLPLGMLAAGVATVRWSRGIVIAPDPSLPPEADLPDGDPRRRLPLSTRRMRWIGGAFLWIVWMGVCIAAAILSKGIAPPLIRVGAFLVSSLGFTVLGARWLQRVNGETRLPLR